MEPDALRDIKPPVYFSTNFHLFVLIAALLLLLALVFLAIYLLKKRAKARPALSPEMQKSAYQVACEALEALRAKNLPAGGRVKEYYFELSDIVRHYLEKRFSLRAPEMTTEEFLYSLGDSPELEDKHKDLLKQFLSHCDLVKFAKYGPTRKEINGSFESAKGLVEETKEAEEGQEEVRQK